MIVEEKVSEIDDEGTQFRVFAFNDFVPESLIVVHEFIFMIKLPKGVHKPQIIVH